MKRIMIAVVLAIFSLVARNGMANDIPLSGLIGYWTGNGNADDSSPTHNNGSFGGSYVSGAPGGGEAFNLGTGKVVIPNNTAYDDFSSYAGYTIGFWFNGNGSPINANNGLFLGQDNGSGYQPKWFVDYGYTVFGPNNNYIFHVNDYNTERIFVASQAEPAPTGWNQLTVTVNNVNDVVSFYLNGAPIGSAYMGPYVLETTASLEFGQAESLSYNGLMSDVAIYNRPLSPGEVQQLASVPDSGSAVILLGLALIGFVCIPGARKRLAGVSRETE